MTVTTTASRDVNNGNGATTAFPVSFKFFVAADLVVTHVLADGTENLKVLTTDYTVTGDGPSATGVVTTTSFTAATGTQVVVERSIPQTQAIDYTANDPFPAETNEEGLDRGVMLSQQLDDLIQRALTLPKNATESGITFPELSGNTAKFLRVNTAEDAFELVTPLAAGTISSPVAIAEGGTNATTAAAARTSLDVQEDVVTTQGDIVVADATPKAARLALGASGTLPRSNGTTLVYVAETALDAPLPRSYLAGLNVSDAADADHDRTVAVGECRDKDNTENMRLTSAITKQIDAVWAVGTDAGGLDTGTVAANETYHIHLIKRTDTGVVDALFSLSPTAPTLPTSYDKSRRIGSRTTDGSANLIGATQKGDEVLLDVVVQDYDANNPGTGAVSRAVAVPTDIQVQAIHGFSLKDISAGNNIFGIVTSLDQANTAPSSTAFTVNTRVHTDTTDDDTNGVVMRIRTNTSAQIRTRISASDADINVIGHTYGWIDTRGRDA